MQRCNCCPRGCNIQNKSNGYCGKGSDIRLARAGVHLGEEPFISGNKGSGTIFFSGCNLKCVFCQNHEISHGYYGIDVSEEKFIDIIKSLEHKGVHNINFVTPTHYFSNIESALQKHRPNIPLVYNSSGYENIVNIEKDIFDIYLFDLKFYSAEKSKRYSNCADYFEKASAVIKRAVEIVGEPQYNNEGIMTRGVVVRHLVVPQSTNDSLKIIEWLNNNAPQIVFSLMSQYIPMYRANEFKEINRKITSREYNKVLEKCFECNFSDVYIQELSSATTEYIPDFDLSGIS